ncbi:hypothetical protein ABPG72_017274 [Tetrahymena utriculariae]
MGILDFDLFSSEFQFKLGTQHYKKGILQVQFYYQDSTNKVYEQFNLDITKCDDPSLGSFNCIDFSKIKNQSIILDSQNNIQPQLYINLYGCNDLDSIKTTIPDNCAPQSEIDSIVNGLEASFYVKLKAQQFNTTSKQLQSNYRNLYLYGLSNQFILNTIKTQKQVTTVDNGLLFQRQYVYSSPIQYDFNSQAFDRKVSLNSGLGPYFRISQMANKNNILEVNCDIFLESCSSNQEHSDDISILLKKDNLIIQITLNIHQKKNTTQITDEQKSNSKGNTLRSGTKPRRIKLKASQFVGILNQIKFHANSATFSIETPKSESQFKKSVLQKDDSQKSNNSFKKQIITKATTEAIDLIESNKQPYSQTSNLKFNLQIPTFQIQKIL